MDYELIDADNHYYEAEDCLHPLRRRGGAEASCAGCRRASGGYILFGDVHARPWCRTRRSTRSTSPGAFHERLKELAEGGDAAHLDMNDLVTLRRAASRCRRLPGPRRAPRVMDEQGLESAVCSRRSASASRGSTRRRADDLQGLPRLQPVARRRLGLRLRGPPLLGARHPGARPGSSRPRSSSSCSRAARKLIVLRPGPANGRSPADPVWDPFWARVQEADVPGRLPRLRRHRRVRRRVPRAVAAQRRSAIRVYERQPAAALYVRRPADARHRRSRSCSATCSAASRTCGSSASSSAARGCRTACTCSTTPAVCSTATSRRSARRRRAAVGDLQAALLGVAVPRGGHRRAHRR